MEQGRNAQDEDSIATSKSVTNRDHEERSKLIGIFQEESAKNEDWNCKYLHSTMFLLGYGAYGSVFQVTTRLYPQSKKVIDKERYAYHPDFLARFISQRKLKTGTQLEKLKDRYRHDRLFDTVAIKYEILDQSHLEDGITRFFLFLRREFLVLDTLWRRFPRLLVGFPVVFDFGYIGDKQQYGVNLKYKDIFTYLNVKGDEVKFFTDTHNRNLEGVTKISFMAMELVGPSIEDYRTYFEPWYAKSNVKPFFQVRTTFRIADQLLCRLYLLHKAGFVHHDIKPDNLAVGSGRALNTIYLLDFGFAKQISDVHVAEWMGSRKFISVDTYNGAKPNYAQDLESWFYLVVALLFDCLPWSDEVIEPMMTAGAEEGAKWAMAASIKETWWGEFGAAHTLHSTLDAVQQLHCGEVPDIRQILQQLHKKVRELRAHLRHIVDAKTLNAELANKQALACRGYMSIRKVLLQIFELPNISKNSLLGDAEFHSYQKARKLQNLMPFKWDLSDFKWEWDKNHAKMLDKRHADGMADLDADSGGESFAMLPLDIQPLQDAHNTSKARQNLQLLAASLGKPRSPRGHRDSAALPGQDNDRRLRMRAMDGGTTDKQTRRDEVSWVYNPSANCLVPKCQSYQQRRTRISRTGNIARKGL